VADAVDAVVRLTAAPAGSEAAASGDAAAGFGRP